MHTPVVLPYQWLCTVLRGHYAYFGLPSNWDRLGASYQETRRIWYRALNRRSQRRLSWERYVRLLERFPARSIESPILDRWPLADSGKPQEEPSAGSRMLESARAKAKWLSYSTLLPRFSRLAISIIDVECPATRSANQQCPARNSQGHKPLAPDQSLKSKN
jgi:hypothetical protein